jgi:putative transcriptional regulator
VRKKHREEAAVTYPKHQLKFQDSLDFIEMEGWARDCKRLGLDDRDQAALRVCIMSGPDRAAVVPGTGGLRKGRFAPQRWATGKRGGRPHLLRVLQGVVFDPPGEGLLKKREVRPYGRRQESTEKRHSVCEIVQETNHLTEAKRLSNHGREKERKNAMKASVGHEIVTRVRDFAEALKGDKPISERFTCRRVVLDLHPTPYDPDLVRETRKVLGASQAMFACFLGVKTKTVQHWEQGLATPSNMACRFMDEIRRNPAYWLERFKGALISKGG